MVQGPSKTGGPAATIIGGPNVAERLRSLHEIRNPRAFRTQVERGFGDLGRARQDLSSLIFRSTLADEVLVARELIERLVPDKLSALLAVNTRARDRAIAEIQSDRLSLAGDELLAAQDILLSLQACHPTLIPLGQALQAIELKISAAAGSPLPPLSPAVPDSINTPINNLRISLEKVRTIFTTGAVQSDKVEYEKKTSERGSALMLLNQLLRFVSWGGEVQTAADDVKRKIGNIDARINELNLQFGSIMEMLEELSGNRAAGTHQRVTAGAAADLIEMERELEKALESKRQAETESARKLEEYRVYQETITGDKDLLQALGKSPMIRKGIEDRLASESQIADQIRPLIQTTQESLTTISGELTAGLPAVSTLTAVPDKAADEVVRPDWKMVTSDIEGVALGLSEVAAKWPALKLGLEKYAEAVAKVASLGGNDYGFETQRTEIIEALGTARSLIAALLDPASDLSVIKPVNFTKFDHEDLNPALEAVLTKLQDKLAQLDGVRKTDLPNANGQTVEAKQALNEAIILTNDPLFKDLLTQLEQEVEGVLQAGKGVDTQTQLLSPMLGEKLIWIEEMPAASGDPLLSLKQDLAKVLQPGVAANLVNSEWTIVASFLAQAELDRGLADSELKLLFEQVRAVVPPLAVDFEAFRDTIENRDYDYLKVKLPSIIAVLRYRVPHIGETLSNYLRSNVLQKIDTFKDKPALRAAIISTFEEAFKFLILPAAVTEEVKDAARVARRAFLQIPNGTPSIPPPPPPKTPPPTRRRPATPPPPPRAGAAGAATPPPPGPQPVLPVITTPRELSEAVAKYSGADWGILIQAIKEYFKTKTFRPEIQADIEKTLSEIDIKVFATPETLREEVDRRIRKVIYDGRTMGYWELDQVEIDYIGS